MPAPRKSRSHKIGGFSRWRKFQRGNPGTPDCFIASAHVGGELPVANPHSPIENRNFVRGLSSVGRAPQWHCGGQGFESPRLQSLLAARGAAKTVAPLPPVAPKRSGGGWRRRTAGDYAMRLVASYDSAGQIKTNRFAFACRAAESEDNAPEQMNRFIYVYILQSEADSNRFYIGRTQNLRARISRHNSGQVRHTAKRIPWRIKTYVVLSDSTRTTALEHYLKSASGRAFIKKRL